MFDLLKKILEDANVPEVNPATMVKDTTVDPATYDVDTILNKLEAGEDEVDTITFGLENDEGDIIKVYVNAEQADDFEKALAAKLGEEDNIEILLSDLNKDFDIVDVIWPDDEEEAEVNLDALKIDSEKKDELVDDELQDGAGEESMNKNIKETTYGDKVKSRLFQKFEIKEASNKITAVIDYVTINKEAPLSDFKNVLKQNNVELVAKFLGGNQGDEYSVTVKGTRENIRNAFVDDMGFDEDDIKYNIVKEAEQNADDIEINMDPEATEIMDKYKNEYIKFGFEVMLKLGLTPKMIENLISRNPSLPREILNKVRDMGAAKRNIIKRGFSIE